MENVVKQVGRRRVLNGIDCTFRIGELTMIRSTSPADRTILARILIGQIYPDWGRVTRVKPCAALVGGVLGFPAAMAAFHGLDLIAAAFGLDARDLRRAVSAMMDDPEAVRKPFNQLSGRDRTALLFGASWLCPTPLYVCNGPPLPKDIPVRRRLSPLYHRARRRAAIVWVTDRRASTKDYRPDRIFDLENGRLVPSI